MLLREFLNEFELDYAQAPARVKKYPFGQLRDKEIVLVGDGNDTFTRSIIYSFLNLIGGLDEIDFGSIKVDNKELFGLKQNELSEYRRENLGFVFQFYNLVPNLTVRENIEVCQYLSQNPLDINELLNTIGLKEHENKFPAQLSGGQQQRCAIARALIKNPKLLLCDEPTGALDSKTSKEILILIEKINKKFDTTILIVTHNDIIKNMAHKIIQIKDGKITKDYTNENRVEAKSLEEL